MTDQGQRPHLVTIQRYTAEDDGYGEGAKVWSNHATGWARVRYGTGQERREAAQENASQAATFEFDWNPTISAVRVTDRLFVFGVYWDITGNVTIGGNRESHITAISRLEEPAQIEMGGASGGSAEASAILRQGQALSGLAAGAGTATGSMSLVAHLSGQVEGTGTAAADLSNAEPGGSALLMMDGTPLLLMDGATTLELMV